MAGVFVVLCVEGKQSFVSLVEWQCWRFEMYLVHLDIVWRCVGDVWLSRSGRFVFAVPAVSTACKCIRIVVVMIRVASESFWKTVCSFIVSWYLFAMDAICCC